MRRLAALLVLSAAIAAFAVPSIGRTAMPACGAQLKVGSLTERECTFAYLGDHLSVQGATDATGVAMFYVMPFPALTGVEVTISDLRGNVLLSCTDSSLFASTCMKGLRVDVPHGARLVCTVKAWVEMRYGVARGFYGCASR